MILQNFHFEEAIMYVRNNTLKFIHTKHINKETVNLNEHYQALCNELRTNPLLKGITALQIDVWMTESISHYRTPITYDESMISNF